MYVKSPPAKGKANKEILSYLSDILQIDSNMIAITRGMTSSTKILKIVGISRENILNRITKALQAQKMQ